MRRFNAGPWLNIFLFFLLALLLSSAGFVQQTEAVTASYGQPYNGRLVNGIPFPTQFPGYQLREEERTYTTPEIVGAMLDAVEGVRTRFPETCDLYIGDFSYKYGGGSMNHRSHQNGRDVDVGMYAKGNRKLDQFVSMNEENLDVPKTWCLVEGIIRSQRVQYIFLDRRVQRLLYDYAVSQGADAAYLDHVFGNVRGSLIQHVGNHHDHIHVRFFTPWSTLAAHVGEEETQKRTVIEMAQQSYLPKQVNYYVKGNERSLDALARSFGVTSRDLCRWNRISGSSALTPGSCLVFYKRSFEVDSVHLAQSLQPGFVAETPPIQYASLRRSADVLSDVSTPEREEISSAPSRSSLTRTRRHEAPSTPSYTLYRVQKGDTIDKIARKNKIDVRTLCRMNGMKKPGALKPGHTIKLAMAKSSSAQDAVVSDASPGAPSSRSSRNISLSSDNATCSTAATYTVGKGETLQKISRKTGIGIDALCQMNGLKKGTALKPGQKIKLAQTTAKTCPTRFSPASSSKSQSTGKNHAAAGEQSRGKTGASSKDVKATSKSTKASKETKSVKGSSKEKASAKSASAAATKNGKAQVKAAAPAGIKNAKDAKAKASSSQSKDTKIQTKAGLSGKDSKAEPKKQGTSKAPASAKGKADKLARK
ncbi:penicillin-insensitive murein endopeptidase [Syntrophobacter fumaroxidans]|uniref:Peptidoglycan-binding LysM n=1 Tax=Syntrophobacter fumaroxidans (strain DSM 10017 / MPOB) TaxID=335543 RepID=A0LM11_SYNFM|nr:penicillin-insensitive murein endopeptidase [Syntrophobacter fumaroxidans]ABK18463.1 Peptidoglycan-binding LysM [Syntrophobacter fumaroxidans MPOB]